MAHLRKMSRPGKQVSEKKRQKGVKANRQLVRRAREATAADSAATVSYLMPQYS
jgi:hypothetical protein